MKSLFRKIEERKGEKVKNVIYKEGEKVHEGRDILLQVAQEKASSSKVRATGTLVGQSAYRSKRSRRQRQA